MPYIAPVVAYSDSLGRLWCASCGPHSERENRPEYADNGAMDGETCDGCGEPIAFSRSAKVYVASSSSY